MNIITEKRVETVIEYVGSMKRALVLAGGGTRGAYQNGAIHALRDLNEANFDIVTGTSIGALNGALFVQQDFDVLDDLWHNLTQTDIIKGAISTDLNLDTIINERNLIGSFFSNYIKERGADISPFIEKTKKLYNPTKFLESPIDFGCIVVEHKTLNPIYVSKEMMKENGTDWLIASASAFPVFPVYKFQGHEYVDGGYFDNLPIDYALQLGADEIVAVDLSDEPRHPNYVDHITIKYIYPKEAPNRFLSFDQKALRHMETIGYNDTMKAFGKYSGLKYTFKDWKTPSYLKHFINQILLLETKIKLSNNFNESIRKEDYIQEEIRRQVNKRSVTDEEIFFGVLDRLMSVCGFDSESVYTYEDVRNHLCVIFKESIEEDYPFLPASLNPKNMVDYIKSLDVKGIIEKMIHTSFYESHMLSENLLLTVYPFEYAMAALVIEMMQELGRTT